MRDVELEWFSLQFQRAFLSKRGSAFQDFFADIMDAAYPGSFERVRPYGSRGDLKCDGFLRPEGLIFQVYAPREMRLNELCSKIRTDFNGAKRHWKGEMRAWAFVHNDSEGLPGDALKLLEDLRRRNARLRIETWSEPRLNTIALSMPRPALIRLFGRPPARHDFDTLGFEELAHVLQEIRGQRPHAELEEIRPVSPTKLEANALSPAAAWYLRLGRQRERLVEQYFETHPNPTFGEEIAVAFRERYAHLKAEGRTADSIFTALQEFAGGSTRGDAEHEAAILAVLSYLFERCDIFEPPAGEVRT